MPPVWIRKKTCPHCRAVVRDRPSEVWTIKEMVATLVKSGLASALPEPPQPAEGPANADPWVDIFPPTHRHNNAHEFGEAHYRDIFGLRDDEDGGIFRCVDCNHEIEDHHCTNCGRWYATEDEVMGADDFSDDDHSDSAFDDEPPWGVGGFGDMPLLPFFNLLQAGLPYDRHWDGEGDTEIESDGSDGRGGPRGGPRARIQELDENDNRYGEEGYESSFIDDDEDEEPHYVGQGRAPSAEHQDPIELSDDEDEGEVGMIFLGPRGRSRQAPIVLSDDEETYDEDGYGIDDDSDSDEE